jgi:hypothetical protein
MANYRGPAYSPRKQLRAGSTIDTTVTLAKQFVALEDDWRRAASRRDCCEASVLPLRASDRQLGRVDVTFPLLRSSNSQSAQLENVEQANSQ